MAEATKAETRRTRKRPGFRKVMITVTEDQGKRLDELALADDRRGKATEMLTILVKRNFEALLKTIKPVNPTFQFGQTVFEVKGAAPTLQAAEEVPGVKSRSGE